MLAFLKLVFGFLGGGVAQSIADAYKAKEQAATDQERIAADERISRLQAIRDTQRAEAGSRINASIRAFIALGPALYIFKIFAVDKVMCSVVGCSLSTDPLTPELWEVVKAVVLFYFLYELGINSARILKR